MMLGPERGAIVGFFAGLTLDLLVQTPLGLSALVYCLVGYGMGRLQGTVLRANRLWPLVLVAASSAAAIALYAVVAEVFGQSNAISTAFAGDRCWWSPSATPSCTPWLDAWSAGPGPSSHPFGPRSAEPPPVRSCLTLPHG